MASSALGQLPEQSSDFICSTEKAGQRVITSHNADVIDTTWHSVNRTESPKDVNTLFSFHSQGNIQKVFAE